MEAKLPCLALLCALVNTGDLWSQAVPASLAARAVSPTAASPSIGEVVTAMAEHASVEAKVRQQSRLFGELLVGSGRYLQQGRGTDMLVRFELRMQVAGQVGSVLEVGDGRYLWRDLQMPSGRSVSRIVLWRVFDRLGQERSVAPGNKQVVPVGQRLALGGLPKLLAALADNFEFAVPSESQIGSLPVYALRGVWRPDKLALILQGQAADAQTEKPVDLENIPEHIPHEVLLLVGRDDLFPYVIEYLGKPLQSPTEPGSSGRRQTLVRMQLYEVRLGTPIDSRQFVYNPGAIAIVDETEQFLQRLVVGSALGGVPRVPTGPRTTTGPRSTTGPDATRY